MHRSYARTKSFPSYLYQSGCSPGCSYILRAQVILSHSWSTATDTPLSAINLFSSSRQIRKTTRDGVEELWLEKTYLTTEEAFPTVLRRSEVVGLEVVEISPLENALNDVEQKTKELIALHLKYQTLAKTSQSVSTNALAMSLNSAVDAPVNTGIASYRQMFFNSDYVERNPEREEMVEKLRGAIDEQV